MNLRRLTGLTLLAALGASGSAQALPLVALDPGHGGRDTGAVGILPDGTATGLQPRVNAKGETVLYEKDVNLDIALRVSTALQGRGFPTLLTRTTDAGAGDVPFPGTRKDLERRTEIANSAGAEIFVSLHENALAKTTSGTETFHFYVAQPESVALALAVHQEVVIRLGLADRGLKKAGFYVLKHTVMPSVLVEGAFLTNPDEARMLAQPEVRQAMAEGVANGVDRFTKGLVVPTGPYGAPRQVPVIQPVRYWVTAGVFRTGREAKRQRERLSRRGIDSVVRRRYVARAGRPLNLVVTGQFIQLRNARGMRDRLRRIGFPGRIANAPGVRATSWSPPRER
jgi:N-acetylmuramoyl-L-alanine amidase